MRIQGSFLSLPTSLILFLATEPLSAVSQKLQWPYNLPPHVKYFPEDEAMVKRELSLQQKIQKEPVVGVRKMSADPDEKFYLDYWSFDTGANDQAINSWTNTSAVLDLRPCTPLHSNETVRKASRHRSFSFWSRSPFDKRDFQCPSGTNACTAIGYPNSCCPTGEICQIVQDTGLGNVGCCPAGSTCAGSLSTCAADQTACASDLGGGCCIAGYACLDVGCVYTGTATVLVTPTTSSVPRASTTTVTITTVITPTIPSASPTTVISTKTLVPVPPPESTTSTKTSTSTLIVLPTRSTTTTTSTTHTTVAVLTCSLGFKSCPASLGGGCCTTDRACGSAYCPALSSTESPNVPIRPTTDTTITAATSTITGIGCPTGYYACSAYYQGGCCQVGRDCAKTNCPATASTTLVSGSGITIVAPTGSGISTADLATGVCAAGWQTCAPSNGGGCCPSGYACGSSCTAAASDGGSIVTGKEAPQSGAMSRVETFSGRLATLVLLISVFIM